MSLFRSPARKGWYPVLPPFRQEMRPLPRLIAKTGILIACLFLGVFYGFVFAVFPPFMLIYAAIPLVVLAAVIIWALPEVEKVSLRPFIAVFLLAFGSKLLWPEYLAPNIPGLPAISVGRVTLVLLMLALIITLSMSRAAKRDLIAALGEIPLWKILVALNVIQLYTIFLSVAPVRSFNMVLVTLQAWTGIYIASVLAFTNDRARALLPRILVGSAFFLCAMGMVELQNQAILWAKNFPTFFRYDEVIAGILEPKFRDGGYRVTTIYTTSLSFAEYLALASPFFLHNLMRARQVHWMAFWAAANLLLLFTILKTGARLGIVGMFTADTLYLMIWSFRRWRVHNKADLVGPAMSLAFPVAAAVFLVSMFTVDAVRYRTISGSSTGFSDDARWTQFEMAIPDLIRNPLGYGLGSSGEVIGYTTPGGQVTVDSYVLTVLVDLGVVGLLLYSTMLLLTMWKLGWIAFLSDSEDDFIAAAVVAAIGSWITSKLVLSQGDNDPLIFVILGYATALAWSYAKRTRPAAGGQAAGAHLPAAPSHA